MSAQARRERAYRHYVAKQMKQRQKAIARAQKQANRELKRKMKNLQPSEPKITTTLEDAEMTSVFAPAQAPVADSSEEVEPKVTVSASDSILAGRNPDRPSRP